MKKTGLHVRVICQNKVQFIFKMIFKINVIKKEIKLFKSESELLFITRCCTEVSMFLNVYKGSLFPHFIC